LTVPVAWKKLDSVAESVTDWPTWIELDERDVMIVVMSFWTARGSQGETAGLLLLSPEYVALKLYDPVALKVTGLEFGITLLDTVTIDTMVGGAVQAPFVNKK
jgi:hypothetical protein